MCSSDLLKIKRDYYSCILVDFTFRGIPQKVAQQSHFAFGGRVEATFSAYALNDDELKMFEKELGESDLDDVLKLIERSTTESLEQLQKEINYFLDEEKEKEEEKKTGSNPFLALIGFYNKKPEQKKEKKKEDKKKEIGRAHV